MRAVLRKFAKPCWVSVAPTGVVNSWAGDKTIFNSFASLAIIVVFAFTWAPNLEQHSNSEVASTLSSGASVPEIAAKTKNGVEVRVNRIQRIGTDVRLPQNFEKLDVDGVKLTRTIAISICQKGQGNFRLMKITLQNGEILNPCMQGNPSFMSVLANATIPNGFDFMETWFEFLRTRNSKMFFRSLFPIRQPTKLIKLQSFGLKTLLPERCEH